MYTIKDIATMTSMTPRTIQNYLAKGLIKGIKVGGQWRFTDEQVKAFFDQGAVVAQVSEVQHSRLQDQVESHSIPNDRSSTLTAVWDVKIDDDKRLDTLVNQLMTTIRQDIKGGLDNFSFTYNEELHIARFSFIGTIETIKKLLEVLHDD